MCAAILLFAGCEAGEVDGPEPDDYGDDPGADEGELPLEGVPRPELVPGAAVAAGAARALAPAAGEGVMVEAILDDGSTDILVLEADAAGAIVEYLGGGRPAPEEVGPVLQSSPAPCQDGAHSLMPFHWTQTLAWRFNAGTTPAGMSVANVEGQLVRGTGNITTSRDDCGMVDRVSATHTYLGHTTRAMDIASDGSCTTPNGENGVGFGALPAGVLGVTCTWWSDHVAVESDVRLNAGDRWYVTRPSSCTNRFSIQAVMTHERGHTFGLGHVAESNHAALTMSTAIRACSSGERTLGLGDVRGLRKKY